MPRQREYPDIQSVAFAIYREVSDYLSKDGMAWLVGKLRTNIVRTVYRRMEHPDVYERTDSFKNSVRGRVIDKGHYHSSFNLEVMAFADPSDMSPLHTSWATGTPNYGNWDVNVKLADWLESGHGGMGVNYKPARFIKKTEEEIDNPNGLIRGLTARLRAIGFVVHSDVGGKAGDI